MRPALIIVSILLALVVLAHIVFAAVAPRSVGVVELERAPLVQTVVATGRVDAPRSFDVGSLVGATVQIMAVDVGDTVAVGQLLAQLENGEATADYRRAAAEVSAARAVVTRLEDYDGPVAEQQVVHAAVILRNAAADLERTESLSRAGLLAARDLEVAAERLAAAREVHTLATLRSRSARPRGGEHLAATAAVQAAQAALASAEARLAKTRITARQHAVVLERRAQPGDVVQPGSVLMTLAPVTSTLVLVQLDERALAVIAPGQIAVISADAMPDRTFAATVERVAPAVDRERGTIEVRLHVPDPPPFLRPDMTVSVTIEARRSTAGFAVPAAAVLNAGTDPAVLIVRAGVIDRVPVTIGLRGPGTVEVVGAMQEGEIVVVPEGIPPEPGTKVSTRPWSPPADRPTRSGSGIPFH